MKTKYTNAYPLASLHTYAYKCAMSTITHIRKYVFAVSQDEFAAIAGVTQPTVSRWERGAGESMTLEQMARIRAAATARSIEWDDCWFFHVPASASAEAAE